MPVFSLGVKGSRPAAALSPLITTALRGGALGVRASAFASAISTAAPGAANGTGPADIQVLVFFARRKALRSLPQGECAQSPTSSVTPSLIRICPRINIASLGEAIYQSFPIVFEGVPPTAFFLVHLSRGLAISEIENRVNSEEYGEFLKAFKDEALSLTEPGVTNGSRIVVVLPALTAAAPGPQQQRSGRQAHGRNGSTAGTSGTGTDVVWGAADPSSSSASSSSVAMESPARKRRVKALPKVIQVPKERHLAVGSQPFPSMRKDGLLYIAGPTKEERRVAMGNLLITKKINPVCSASPFSSLP